MRVAILGCSGRMGRLFTKYFLKRGYQVVGSDKRASKRLPGGFTFTLSNADAVKEAEFVLVAVPLEETVRAADEVVPFMKRGSTLVEITSVKGKIPAQLRRKLEGRRLFLLSIHPLFGPLARVEGSKISVIGGSRGISTARRLFPEARLIPMRGPDHDRMIAFALTLVHTTNFAFLLALAKGIGVKRFERVAPPLGSAQLNLSKAVLSSSPSLFGHIQVDNPFAVEVLSSLIEELEDLRKAIAKNDLAGLERKFSRLASEFKGDELDRALQNVYRGPSLSPVSS